MKALNEFKGDIISRNGKNFRSFKDYAVNCADFATSQWQVNRGNPRAAVIAAGIGCVAGLGATYLEHRYGPTK